MKNERLGVGSWKLEVGTAVLLVDQAAKYFSPFEIKKNPGLPFGIDLPGSLDFYLVAGLLAIFIFFHRLYYRQLSFGFMFVASGALSNLLDRMYFGYVRDIIDIGIATINVADVMIWIGIFVLIIQSLKIKMKNDSVKF